MEIKPPRDKFDLDAVAALAGADGATLCALLPELLAWLQDGNWLVAAPLADVLRPHQQAFDAEIAAVLRGEDAVWKVSLLAGLLDYRAGRRRCGRRSGLRLAQRRRSGQRGRMKRRGIFWRGGGSLKRGFSLATSLCYAGGF
ncbi:DUF5071 domain-containing protein [Kingella oralis]|uniref:DUF5071 domain-containing protein n=1 Tax=Kingella oralis TaxID=505 RepID=UPI002D7FEB35|nr:DUF5071 domain-containing protein [Kingella oralis]